MLSYIEITSNSTIVSLSPISSLENERETGPLPSSTDSDNYVPLLVGYYHYRVSPTLKEGYLAACRAYTDMEQTEYGPYTFLTGYEYAHLTRRHIPSNLSSVDKPEWHRGFVLGWNACTFGFEEQEA